MLTPILTQHQRNLHNLTSKQNDQPISSLHSLQHPCPHLHMLTRFKTDLPKDAIQSEITTLQSIQSSQQNENQEQLNSQETTNKDIPASTYLTTSTADESEKEVEGQSGFLRHIGRWLGHKKKRILLNAFDISCSVLMDKKQLLPLCHRVIRSFKSISKDIEKSDKINDNYQEKKMINAGNQQDYSQIKLDNLIYIKKLGIGQFGSVYLVRDKENGELYALKSVSKSQITEQNLEKHLLQEKQILETVNFSFIMKFLRTFKDNQSVYFLVEFISGIELFDVIRDIGLLSTQDSQFYIGTLILCLEYLHSRNIIYRDIKPENLMVDSKGYMYMIDMGTAKILNQSKHPGRTFTIIGTPHYMAPEIILGKGYSYAADLWGVGICLYEFLCGGVPYAEEAEDPYEIYEEIIKENSVKFPAFLKDKKAKRLMDQLLSKIPEKRLGGSFAALKSHPWFDSFNWDNLLNKKILPPYTPPNSKVISDKEILNIAKQGKLVIDEIKAEQEKSKIYNKDQQTHDSNWDKDF